MAGGVMMSDDRVPVITSPSVRERRGQGRQDLRTLELTLTEALRWYVARRAHDGQCCRKTSRDKAPYRAPSAQPGSFP